MKKFICILLMVLLTVSVCACAGAKEPTAEQTGSAENSTVAENDASKVSTPASETETESTEATVPGGSGESGEANAASDSVSETASDLLAGHIIELPDDLFEGGQPIGVNGDWIYYADKDYLLLGRVHLDGSDRLRYENQEIYYPCIEGDRIYYVGGEEENCLYAMEFDGTEVTLLREERADCHLSGVEFLDGRIHYAETDDPIFGKYDPENDEYYTDWGETQCYSVKTDGTDKKEQIGGMPESDGWIYRWVKQYGDHRICRIRPDGSEKTVLTDFEVRYYWVYDGWVYYTLWKESGFFKMRTDGTDTQKVCNDEADMIYYNETYLYYVNYSDEAKQSEDSEKRRGTLYKIKTDGTDRKKLSDRATEGIFVSSDTVFFEVPDFPSWELYAINKDGTNERFIAKNHHILLRLDSGFIYKTEDGAMYFYSYEKLAS